MPHHLALEDKTLGQSLLKLVRACGILAADLMISRFEVLILQQLMPAQNTAVAQFRGKFEYVSRIQTRLYREFAEEPMECLVVFVPRGALVSQPEL